ncbi:unnamed protein product [Lampetra planeri]
MEGSGGANDAADNHGARKRERTEDAPIHRSSGARAQHAALQQSQQRWPPDTSVCVARCCSPPGEARRGEGTRQRAVAVQMTAPVGHGRREGASGLPLATVVVAAAVLALVVAVSTVNTAGAPRSNKGQRRCQRHD